MRSMRWMVALLLAVLLGSAFAVEIPLTYKRAPETGTDDEQLASYGSRFLDESQALPKGDWKLPAFQSKTPFRYLLKFGDRDHLLVVDANSPEDKQYSTLYFDANANHDLTDEPAVQGKVESDDIFVTITFPAIDFSIVSEGKEFPYSFRPQMECLEPRGISGFVFKVAGRLAGGISDAMRWVDISSISYYEGEWEIDGRKVRIELLDGNVNGRYDDFRAESPPGAASDVEYLGGELDQLRFVFEGDPRCQIEVSPNDTLAIGGQIFGLKVDLAAGKLIAEPLSGDVARLKLAVAPTSLVLSENDSGKTITALFPSESVAVPPGKYRLRSYSLTRKDEAGCQWRLDAEGSKKALLVDAVKDAETALSFGEPFVAQVYAELEKRSGGLFAALFGIDEQRLEFALEGVAKETVSQVTKVPEEKTATPMSARRPSMPKEPTYKITKADGEVVAQGSFEYG